MKAAARPNRINIDLQQYKQPWIDYCKARETTPSEAFRLVVAKLTASTSMPEAEVLCVNGEGKIRKEIRLTADELARAEAVARQEGFALNRWVVALVRARLDSTPQLGQQELEALARSNMQLLALGRNLNQIAKAVQANEANSRMCRPELIEQTAAFVRDHVNKVSVALAANTARWSAK